MIKFFVEMSYLALNGVNYGSNLLKIIVGGQDISIPFLSVEQISKLWNLSIPLSSPDYEERSE